MRKKLFLLVIGLINTTYLFSDVGYGGTYVIPHDYGASCFHQQYVEVGFFTNFEINMSNYQIERSTDPNFNSWSSWIDVGGQMTSCGTCGSGQYSQNDYGPFAPNQTWYYRVEGTSNFNSTFIKYLGSYSTNAPTTFDWVNQVTSSVNIGSTPPIPSSYSWNQISDLEQGVSISLDPSEIADIYIQQSNSKLNLYTSDIIVNIDINIDNAGYTNLYNGTSITNYLWDNIGSLNSNIGDHDLKLRYTNSSAIVVYREYNVHVVQSSIELHASNNCDVLRVYGDPNNSNPIPIIISEGFDSYNTTSPEFFAYAGKDLFSCLISKGFKIYIINYTYNSQDMRNNAAIYSSAISYVSSINGNKQIIVGGISMGGVIARYALAKAENDGTPLPAYKFVTMDSPHQYAVVSKSLQDFKWDQQHSQSNASFLLNGLNSTAARELLINNTYENGKAIGSDYSITNNAHSTFYSELNALNGNGYPHLTENIGVAFSNPYSPNQVGNEWLRIDGVNPAYSFNVQSFYIESEEDEAGSYLPNSSTYSDPAAAYLEWWLNLIVTPVFNTFDITLSRYLNPTFIPHASALDIIGGNSKFDKTIFTNTTTHHDEVPPDIIEPLVIALLKDNIYIQNRTFSSNADIVSGQNIYAGNNVTSTIPQGNIVVQNGTNVTFRAGQSVNLQPGFTVNNGANFHALIGVHCDATTETQGRVANNQQKSSSNSTTSNTITSIQSDKIVSQSVSIFPNPTTGIVNLNYNSQKGGNIVALLTDVTGSTLSNNSYQLEVGLNNLKLDLSNFSPGVYTLAISDNSGKVIKRNKIILSK